MELNQYGLSRDIPAAVRRAVRKRCGFGCVVCGSAIYQYEHLDPPFANAKSHDADKIVLLCGACHDRVTRGYLSKTTVAQAATSPKALEKGYSFGAFDVGYTHPDVILGPFRAVRTATIIEAYDVPLLSITAPEVPGAPFRLSALLCDSAGNEILRIVENEWQTPVDNWDAEVTGGRIVLRRDAKDITLRLRVEPPQALVVEKLRMYYRGALIECVEGDAFQVTAPDGSVFRAFEIAAVECEAGVKITETGLMVGYKCKGGLQFTVEINP